VVKYEQGPNCPKCGHEGRCFHEEVGGPIDYVDEYTFTCKNKECNYTERQTESGSSVSGNSWETSCPFCHHSSRDHNSLRVARETYGQ
jgi:hypothetical protein